MVESVRQKIANFRFILNFSTGEKRPPLTGRACCSAGRSGVSLAPQEIDGNAEQYDNETRKSLSTGLVRNQEYYRDRAGKHDVECRKHGIADRPVRTLRVGPELTQPEQPDRRQRIEDERGKDHVVEKLAVTPG